MRFSKKELLELLKMDFPQFDREFACKAKELYRESGDRLYASAMLGFDNVCRNRCLYCGMRAGMKLPERFRMTPEDVIASARQAKEMGFSRFFLISGEDPGYPLADIIKITEQIHAMGLHLSLALGELPLDAYQTLKEAGADEYVLKFEMSDPETFNRLNPSTEFHKRMAGIEAVKKSGMKLASGNIVDFPGQGLSQLADDILLMEALEISWAPVIPYLPAAGTPLAQEGGRGNIYLNLKEIALLRLMMPSILITAQQPGRDMKEGLGGEEGNRLALTAGANLLFADMLPDARVRNFSVIDNRAILSLNHIRRMAEITGMDLRMESTGDC